MNPRVQGPTTAVLKRASRLPTLRTPGLYLMATVRTTCSAPTALVICHGAASVQPVVVERTRSGVAEEVRMPSKASERVTLLLVITPLPPDIRIPLLALFRSPWVQ